MKLLAFPTGMGRWGEVEKGRDLRENPSTHVQKKMGATPGFPNLNFTFKTTRNSIPAAFDASRSGVDIQGARLWAYSIFIAKHRQLGRFFSRNRGT